MNSQAGFVHFFQAFVTYETLLKQRKSQSFCFWGCLPGKDQKAGAHRKHVSTKVWAWAPWCLVPRAASARWWGTLNPLRPCLQFHDLPCIKTAGVLFSLLAGESCLRLLSLSSKVLDLLWNTWFLCWAVCLYPAFPLRNPPTRLSACHLGSS